MRKMPRIKVRGLIRMEMMARVKWTNAWSNCGLDQTGGGLSWQKPDVSGAIRSETLKSALEIYSVICLAFTATTICIHQ